MYNIRFTNRYIGVTQYTAYTMLLKLRFLFSQEDTILEGDNVSIDEMYHGSNHVRKDPILFNPYEYFEKYKGIINEVVVDHVVYRRADFLVR